MKKHTQMKINSQLKMEITEVRTLFKSRELENLLIEKFTLLQTNKPKLKTHVESDEPLKDDLKNVKTIGRKAFEPELNKEIHSSLVLEIPQLIAPFGKVIFSLFLYSYFKILFLQKKFPK